MMNKCPPVCHLDKIVRLGRHVTNLSIPPALTSPSFSNPNSTASTGPNIPLTLPLSARTQYPSSLPSSPVQLVQRPLVLIPSIVRWFCDRSDERRDAETCQCRDNSAVHCLFSLNLVSLSSFILLLGGNHHVNGPAPLFCSDALPLAGVTNHVGVSS